MKMVFRWRADDGPFIATFGSYPLINKKNPFGQFVEFEPPLSESAHVIKTSR